MFAKLLKLLSGIAAMAERKSDNPQPNHLRSLEEYRGLQDTNNSLIQERHFLRNQLRQAESRADGVLGNEYAEELDRVKALLQDAYGFSVSRMQVASAVEDLSGRLNAMGNATRSCDCGSCRGF